MSQPISGCNGKVMIGDDALAEVTRWSFTRQAATSRYASNATGGCLRTFAGAKSGSGLIEFLLDVDATSTLVEGASVTLLLYLDDTKHFTVPAIIKQLHVEVTIDSVQLVSGSAQFETDGSWTDP